MGGCNTCCKGGKMLVLGALLIANDMFWQYPWASFIGALLVVKGLLIWAMKGKCMCGGGSCCMPEEKGKHKKKK